MEKNLINEIKKAEKTSEEIIRKAETDAENMLNALLALQKEESENLETVFKKKVSDSLKKAEADSGKISEEKEEEAGIEVQRIKKRGEEKKEEVISFILDKITG